MSVLANVLAQVSNLLEGKNGVERTIPTGTFKRVDSDKDFSIALAGRNPRPFFVIPQTLHGMTEEPSDVAGNYAHFNSTIEVSIFYAERPHARESLFQTIANDGKTLIACLSYPDNWAQVDNCIGAEIELTTEPMEDENGQITLWALVITLLVSYREDLSN